MRKRNFVKLFLTFMVIVTLTLFLSGCIIIFDDEPIVYINVDDNWEYKIYVDGRYHGTTNMQGKLTLYDVSTGNHKFEAKDTSIFGFYGSKWQWIVDGPNTVNINVE